MKKNDESVGIKNIWFGAYLLIVQISVKFNQNRHPNQCTLHRRTSTIIMACAALRNSTRQAVASLHDVIQASTHSHIAFRVTRSR